MKILAASQISQLDAYTIQNEPIASIHLMERAANAYCKTLLALDLINPTHSVFIFCGPGNNGGDGLAIGRILFKKGYRIQIVRCKIGRSTSEDFQINLERLPNFLKQNIITLEKGDSFTFPKEKTFIIDAIFGTGLSRPVEGYWGHLIEEINSIKSLRFAVDIPSGLFTNQSSIGNTIVKADYTITFQMPKLAFLLPENAPFVGYWQAVDIGLNKDFIRQSPTDYYFVDEEFIKPIFLRREKFGHKGTYGHALMIVGSYGMAGAAILSTRAALRAGVGLLDIYVPEKLYEILQTSVPEAMVKTEPSPHPDYFSVAFDTAKYQAVGIGCGLGKAADTARAFGEFLEAQTSPIVIDADALNILASERNFLSLIPPRSILTPHPGEFKRLFGNSENNFKRLTLQKEKAQSLNVYILLKGAHSALATPEGEVFFNSTGNPGMATAGSGDVLTGIITGLMAQSYTPFQSALLGMYVHGEAGNLASQRKGQTGLTAQDIIETIPEVFLRIEEKY